MWLHGSKGANLTVHVMLLPARLRGYASRPAGNAICAHLDQIIIILFMVFGNLMFCAELCRMLDQTFEPFGEPAVTHIGMQQGRAAAL